jgi:hypothetical protein
MAGQSSSVDESACLRYLNANTCSIGLPCTMEETSCARAASSAASHYRLWVMPSWQNTELWCLPANAAIGMCILQSLHCGRRPSFKMTMMSQGCRYLNCRQRLAQDDACFNRACNPGEDFQEAHTVLGRLAPQCISSARGAVHEQSNSEKPGSLLLGPSNRLHIQRIGIDALCRIRLHLLSGINMLAR